MTAKELNRILVAMPADADVEGVGFDGDNVSRGTIATITYNTATSKIVLGFAPTREIQEG